jgi:hypothetical protein
MTTRAGDDERAHVSRSVPAGWRPGAATGAAIPGDRVASVSAELAPVFDALVATVARCDQIREEARAEAARRVETANEEAHAAVSRAAVEAEADRAAEAARLRNGAEAAATRLLDEASEQARQLRTRADARRLDLVTEIMARVRERIGHTP